MKITLEYDSTPKTKDDWIPQSYAIYIDGRLDCSFRHLGDAQRAFEKAVWTQQDKEKDEQP